MPLLTTQASTPRPRHWRACGPSKCLEFEVTSLCSSHVALGEGGWPWASVRAGQKGDEAAADLLENVTCGAGTRQEPGAKAALVAEQEAECLGPPPPTPPCAARVRLHVCPHQMWALGLAGQRPVEAPGRAG